LYAAHRARFSAGRHRERRRKLFRRQSKVDQGHHAARPEARWVRWRSRTTRALVVDRAVRAHVLGVCTPLRAAVLRGFLHKLAAV